jgi:cell division septal protein FtsQ
LQVVAHRASEINYVDMRYSNGFTIGWRTQATPVSAPVQRAEDTDA